MPHARSALRRGRRFFLALEADIAVGQGPIGRAGGNAAETVDTLGVAHGFAGGHLNIHRTGLVAALAIHASGGVPFDGEQAGQAGDAEFDPFRADVVAEGAFKEQGDDQEAAHDGQGHRFHNFPPGESHEGAIGIDRRGGGNGLCAQRQQGEHQRIP